MSRTILVVEDEDLFLLAVTKALTKRGFSVIEACNGSVAMELLRGHKNELDVVLLDVRCPVCPAGRSWKRLGAFGPS